jgi:hypothetical protein
MSHAFRLILVQVDPRFLVLEVLLQCSHNNPMAALITSQNQVKLSTNFSLPKLHSVDAWDAPLVLRVPHSSGAASVASSTSTNRVEKHNVDRAEPCFITNVSSYVHKRAHWINAIRSKAEKNQSFKFKIVSGRCACLVLCIRLIPSPHSIIYCLGKASLRKHSR